VAPTLFGDYKMFVRDYCVTERIRVPGKSGGWMWVDKVREFKNVPHFGHKARHFMILRTPEDVGAELPELWQKPVFLEMEPVQADLYQRADTGEFNVMPGAEIPRKKKDKTLETEEEVQERLVRTEESKMVMLRRALQVVDDPRILDQVGPSVKMEKLLQLLQGDLKDQHVVVFSQFRTCIDLIEKDLAEVGIETLRVTGAESTIEARQEAMRRFREPGPPYVMLLTSAGKKALNLQVSGTLILYDQPLSWGDAYQLIGRIRRMGSTREHVLVIRLLVRDTVDEWIYKILSVEDKLVQECLSVGGTMEITADLLSFIIDKVKSGTKLEDAMKNYAGSR